MYVQTFGSELTRSHDHLITNLRFRLLRYHSLYQLNDTNPTINSSNCWLLSVHLTNIMDNTIRVYNMLIVYTNTNKSKYINTWRLNNLIINGSVCFEQSNEGFWLARRFLYDLLFLPKDVGFCLGFSSIFACHIWELIGIGRTSATRQITHSLTWTKVKSSKTVNNWYKKLESNNT